MSYYQTGVDRPAKKRTTEMEYNLVKKRLGTVGNAIMLPGEECNDVIYGHNFGVINNNTCILGFEGKSPVNDCEYEKEQRVKRIEYNLNTRGIKHKIIGSRIEESLYHILDFPNVNHMRYDPCGSLSKNHLSNILKCNFANEFVCSITLSLGQGWTKERQALIENCVNKRIKAVAQKIKTVRNISDNCHKKGMQVASTILKKICRKYSISDIMYTTYNDTKNPMMHLVFFGNR